MLVDLSKVPVLFVATSDALDVGLSLREAVCCTSADVDRRILERELVPEEVKEAHQDLL